MRFTDSNQQPEIYVLVGLPGSGKSTWTRNFLANVNNPFVVLSTDDVIERIAKEKNSSYNQAIKEHYNEADKEMKQTAKNALKDKINVIWDQTNVGSNKRRKILSQVPKDYRKVAVVFEVDDKELYNRLNRRAEETGKFISSKIIEQMKKDYSEPSKNEGFDEVIKVKG